MLKSLLHDRFDLAVHTEHKSEPAYALTMARRDGRLGSQLHVASRDCRAIRTDPAFADEQDPCGTYTIANSLVTGKMNVLGLGLGAMPGILGIDTGRTVIDQTGLRGTFDWTPSGRHTARRLPGAFVVPLSDATREQLTVFVNGLRQTVAMAPTVPTGPPDEPRNQITEEHLAPRTIEGVRVEGVRRTQSVAAGAIGNERPMVITTEEWTSPELKVLVLSEHTDSRTGTSRYKLVKISRTEPPASLFQVPADYTIMTPGRGGERGGARAAIGPHTSSVVLDPTNRRS